MTKRNKSIATKHGFDSILAYSLTPDKAANWFLGNGILERKGALDKSSHIERITQLPLIDRHVKGLSLKWFKGKDAIATIQRMETNPNLLTWWPLKNTKNHVLDKDGNDATMGIAVMSVWKNQIVEIEPSKKKEKVGRDSKGRFTKKH